MSYSLDLLDMHIWLKLKLKKSTLLFVFRHESLGKRKVCCGKCEDHVRPDGSETLPEGIIAKTSNLERRPLWGYPKKRKPSKYLFAAAVGIKQKETVNEMVQKFLSSDFVVMLFHYDGNVDGWRSFNWSNSVIHISALNQTKWWFAKRFLHPDIVAEYSYIFLWDEDIGVENFNPERYISIVKDEGLEISQPALDVGKSEVHHQITARGRRSRVHRRTYKAGDTNTRCDYTSTAPPCTGWIEVMAPVFSHTAWRCVWYMIQNDLIHAWGLDIQLGYCAQGDRTQNIGVVDAEYIVHYGLPTLGEPEKKKNLTVGEENITTLGKEVRRQSYNEYKVFKRRWKRAVEEDTCWADPYAKPEK
ncbi:putative L-ascorbate oxidase -like protein [Capsicum annuum]|nr:putative L-ascorbate oxidase -like protein [Capsicum annuum]KAF3627926.1 putative L-ascorbate oxidase -like protein [Capsicum annuum]